MKNEKMAGILRILLITMLALAARPLWAAFVSNPSFEDNYTTSNNGGITPDGWTITGSWGVNQAGDPFYNPGTLIADRDRFAFIWHDGTLSQDISGLTPGKQYWLQFWYEGRNCCGGTMVMQVRFGGVPIGAINDVQLATSGFNFANMAFTPTNDTGTLTFQTTVSGDASALFDGVNIVQRDAGNVVIMNPSFEASGPPTDVTGNPPSADSGEIIKPAALAGWTWDTNQSGTYGISLPGGVYADNGAIPDQDLVGFIAGPGSLSQTVSSLVPNTPCQLSFAYNAQSAPGTMAHLQVKAAGTVIDDEDVAPVGGSNPYHTKTVTFTPAGTNAVISFAQTTAGGTLLLDDVRLVGQVVQHFPLTFAPTAIQLAATQIGQVQVTVPPAFLASSAADIQIELAQSRRSRDRRRGLQRSSDAAFCSRGCQCPILPDRGRGQGLVGLRASATANLDVVQVPTVTVFTSFVLNPSFEESDPGVTPITSWTGGSEVDGSSGPFLDNGIIPDQVQVAVLEGTTTLSQQIYGLSPGTNYWLQFRYNASASAGGAVNLKVTLGGNVLATINNIAAVGSSVGDVPFYFTNIVFTPTNASELLEFSTTPTLPNTTPALLLDAVSMVQRGSNEIIIENPSFEAGGEPSPTSYPGAMAGWSVTGGNGVNFSPGDTFGDNGRAPDQGEVLYMWHEGTASALISGLTVGKAYTLIYGVNGRLAPAGSVLTYDVAFGDIPLLTGQTVNSVGDNNPYFTQYLTFTNDASSNLLVFTTHNVGDTTILLDNIHLVPGLQLPPPPKLSVSQSAGMVIITWPAFATGFVLQETSALPGGWTNSAATVTVQGSQNMVNVTPTDMKFYRLKQ